MQTCAGIRSRRTAQRFRGADDEVIAGPVGECRRERTLYLQRQFAGGFRVKPVGAFGKGDHAVEQMVAIAAPSGNVQIEIYLGRCV